MKSLIADFGAFVNDHGEGVKAIIGSSVGGPGDVVQGTELSDEVP